MSAVPSRYMHTSRDGGYKQVMICFKTGAQYPAQREGFPEKAPREWMWLGQIYQEKEIAFTKAWK